MVEIGTKYLTDEAKAVEVQLEEIIFSFDTESGRELNSYDGIENITEDKPTRTANINAGGKIWKRASAAPSAVTGNIVLASLGTDMKKDLLGHTVDGDGTQITLDTVPPKIAITYKYRKDNKTSVHVGLKEVYLTEPNEAHDGAGGEELTHTSITLPYTAIYAKHDGVDVLRFEEVIANDDQVSQDAFIEKVHGVTLTPVGE